MPANKNTAWYLDNSASPPKAPATIHRIKTAPSRDLAPGSMTRPLESSSGKSAVNAASEKNTSGPSGSTQPPAATPNTGATFKHSAAQRPARSENNSRVIAKTSHVEPANIAMNGRRSTTGASLPVIHMAKAGSHTWRGG